MISPTTALSNSDAAATRLQRTAMKEGLLGDTLLVSTEERAQGGPTSMLHAGLELSRNRIDVCLLAEGGEVVAEFATPSDADGSAGMC